MAPVVGLLADNVTGNRPLIFSGFITVGLSLALMGPAPIFPWRGHAWQWAYKTVGMALLGLGVALSIPLVPGAVHGAPMPSCCTLCHVMCHVMPHLYLLSLLMIQSAKNISPSQGYAAVHADMVQGEKGVRGAEDRVAALWGMMFSIGAAAGRTVAGPACSFSGLCIFIISEARLTHFKSEQSLLSSVLI